MNVTGCLLLTGATGFLGSHLLKGLLSQTDASIIVLKRSFSNTFRIESLLTHPRVRVYDVDCVSLELIFQENNIDTILHCATHYGRNESSSHAVLESNLIFPVLLCELAIQYKVATFINTDSYFSKPQGSYSYLLNYSLSKKSLLIWLERFSKQLKIVNVVLEHIYGEHDHPEKFVSQMIHQIAVQQSPSVALTHGDQQRDFIYVDDVVSAYLYILRWSQQSPVRFRTVNVGTGRAISIKTFVETLKHLSHSPTKLLFGRLPYREDEMMHSVAETSELLDMGWTPQHTLEQALLRILEKDVLPCA